MCGIFGVLNPQVSLEYWLQQIKHRGPDSTDYVQIHNIFLGFHRLAINGLNKIGNQPMTLQGVTLCCNGEIYNYKELAREHNIELVTGSDCEIIIYLYLKFGIEQTCQMLDGEYSFILYDHNNKQLYAARDLLGLRGFFYGFSQSQKTFASEAKALGFVNNVKPFPPRTYWSSSTSEFHVYYQFIPKIIERTENEYCELIKKIFTESVKKRVKMSERPVGFLLSGGLDSSLCVALGVKCFDNPKNVNTFSIGFKGSPDLKYAQMVADYLGTTHHSIEYTEKDYLNEIPETIRAIESYDVTTVRASNPHRLVIKYIKEHTDIKVVISGEVSDELTCGYMAFGAISDPDELNEESVRMLNNIHLYDTLRSDRAAAFNGIEGRYPFAAKDFLELYLSIDPKLKSFYKKCRIEKYLLRKAFSQMKLLPDEVLWRRKDGFSDAVSAHERPTRVIISEFVDELISDEEFEKQRMRYNYLKPDTKEELYYRSIFTSYGYDEKLIPGHWRPNPKYYGDIKEPSGRVLDTF